MHHPSLSWEANGVLCWARTQPTFTLKNLLRKGTGRDRAYRILRELLALGYLERFERRDESGKFLEYGYRMALNPKKPVAENPEAVMARAITPFGENPEAVPPLKPLTAKPDTVEDTQSPLRLTANPHAAECRPCEEKGTQSHFPFTAKPEAVNPRASIPLTENPDAVSLPEPFTANPDTAECASCVEKDSQSRFPLTAEPHTEQPLTAEPDAAPEDSSTRGTENVSHTKIEPLRENPQTDEQPSFFKSLKEEILNELLSVFNKQKEEILTEVLNAVNSLSKKKGAAKAESSAQSGKPDAVAELAASLGLSDWQRNFARAAVREEAARAAWFGLARHHPEVLKASYRLLDKTGQRTPVAWVAWLPHLAEDVQRQGAEAVQRCIEKAITSASPAGAWGYYRACLEGNSRARESAYERLAPEYRIVKRIPGKETVYAQ
jgi:hypothetical protein